jgi:hypothetical protein
LLWARSWLNIKDVFIDVAMVLALVFNIVGFWRLPMLKARK